MTDAATSAPAVDPRGASGQVVVVGGDAPLADRVVERLATRCGRSVSRIADPLPAGLGPDVGTVVLLGGPAPDAADDVDGTGSGSLDTAWTRQVLAQAAASGADQLVVLSSAMVYGAWSDNPVPLTEEATIRPDPAFTFAARRAELERSAAVWRDEARARAPGGVEPAVAVLRPTITVGPERVERFRRSAWRASVLPVAAEEPPRQLLHVHDLAAAVEVAVTTRFDGACNVAPDGWLSAETWRELGTTAPRLPLPGGLLAAVTRVRSRLRTVDAGDRLVPYLLYPWVVANDRLRAAGWEPELSNEEAYVSVDRAGWYRSLGPRARQELSLGAAGAVAAAVVGAGVWFWRRSRRR